MISATVATYCHGCGRAEIPRADYRELKACECGGTRILCSRYEWALVDALRDELGWRRSRGDLRVFSVFEQHPLRAERYDVRTHELRKFEWFFDASVEIVAGGSWQRALVEIDGDNHHDRLIARDKGKEADAVEDGWASTGGLYVVSNRELRPRRIDGEFHWESAYRVAAELVREMLGIGVDGDMSRRRW
jgi:hypothetical protein